MHPTDDVEATWDGPRTAATRRDAASRVPHLSLTVAQHPDPSRVGEHARIPMGGEAQVSRLTPTFGRTGEAARPLADLVLSRRPWRIRIAPSGDATLAPPEGGGRLLVAGEEISAETVLAADALRGGVPMTLADRVTIVAQYAVAIAVEDPSAFGIVGVSPAMAEVQAQIRVFAPHDGPVLLRGESGTGKELVARALHAASARPHGRFVAVNVAALPPSLAASELFGHVRGAFTGASQAHGGFFAAADGGTLFLDEIGDAPVEVQLMLLRAIETGEVTPVGGSGSRRVDVRLVAATDAALEAAVDAGRFRAPLYHRLAGFEIALPPLRSRRPDIGPLLHHFVAAELATQGLGQRLDVPDPGVPMPIPPALLHRLVMHDWPGNVRQLRNVSRQLAVTIQTGGEVSFDAVIARTLAWTRSTDDGPPPAASEVASDGPATRPSAEPLTEARVREVLERHDYRLTPTARALGVARNTLNAWIDAHPTLRRPKDLSAADIREALAATGGMAGDAARLLGVSERGLRLRLRELEAHGG